MKIAVLIEDSYNLLEAWYPYIRLKEEGIEALFMGTGKESYASKEGFPAKADVSVKEADLSSFDGIIIPGGYAPDRLRRFIEINDFVRDSHEKGKMIAAICHAGWVLVSAGILKGEKATCFFAIKDDMINAGAEYVDEEVVVHGNLITSRTPDDLPAFCREIIGFLRKKQD